MIVAYQSINLPRSSSLNQVIAYQSISLNQDITANNSLYFASLYKRGSVGNLL
jgi:hypothetical protein